jgi:hypothetical protein
MIGFPGYASPYITQATTTPGAEQCRQPSAAYYPADYLSQAAGAHNAVTAAGMATAVARSEPSPMPTMQTSQRTAAGIGKCPFCIFNFCDLTCLRRSPRRVT